MAEQAGTDARSNTTVIGPLARRLGIDAGDDRPGPVPIVAADSTSAVAAEP
jgi:hypothetical protein